MAIWTAFNKKTGKGGDRKNRGTSSRYQLSNVNGSFYHPKIALYDNI